MRKNNVIIVLCMALILGLGGLASAQSVGFNFIGNAGAAATMAPGDNAGVPGYEQTNWNNLTGGSGSIADGSLVDSTGAALPIMSVTYTGSGTWAAQDGTSGTPNDILLKGFQWTSGGFGVGTYTITNVRYSSYDVIVYYMNDNGGNKRTELSVSGHPTTFYSENANGGFNGTWVLSTSTTPGTPTDNATHSVHQGVTGSTCVIYHDANPGNDAISAFQIVNTGTILPVPPINPVTSFFPADGATDVSPDGGKLLFLQDGQAVAGYRLFLKEGAAPTATDMVKEIPSSDRLFGLSGLVAGEKTYQWYVEAYNHLETVQSDTMSFTTAAAAGAAPPLPSVNAGLRLHLDASDIDGKGDGATGDPADDTQFTVWADKSGSGHDLTQITGRTSPTLEVDGLNGRPSVWFVANTVLGRADALGFTGNPGMDIILVMNAQGDDSIMSIGAGPRESGTVARAKILNTRARYYFNAGNQQFYNNRLYNRGPLIADFAVPNNPTYFDHRLFDNGVEAVRTGGAGATEVHNMTDDGFTLGAGRANNGNINNQFQGHMSEILIYDNELSGADRASINAYLAAKWGLGSPSVTITAPSADHAELAGLPVTLSAAASDAFGGTIKQVEFFADGVLVGVVTEVNADNEYAMDWTTTATAASINISAIVTDNDTPAPLTASDSVSLTIAPPVYVSTTGAGNGSSFANATNLATALLSLKDTGGTIMMKAGTYPIASEIALSSGIHFYGGFAGTETSPSERVAADIHGANATVLDGGRASRIFNVGAMTYLLNGLELINGNSGGGHSGAIVTATGSKSTFENCTFTNNRSGNRGGVIYAFNGGASITATDCVFTSNSAVDTGGVIRASSVNITLNRCTFEDNHTDGKGGALHIWAGDNLVTNSFFINNTSVNEGGAISLDQGPTTVANCNLFGNNSTGTTSDGIFMLDGTAELWLVNNIFQGHAELAAFANVNPARVFLRNNLLEGATPGSGAGPNGTPVDIDETGTITVAPVFVSATDYNPAAASPVIDAGLGNAFSTDLGIRSFPAADFEGKVRFDGVPDIGAFELAGGGISLSSSALDFGFGLSVGVTTSLTLTVTSIGSLAIDIQSATITGNPSSAVVFETIGDTDPFSPSPTLQTGETLDIVVQMTPAMQGVNYAGQIHVLTVGEASALSADLTGGSGSPPSAVRSSWWLLYE